MAPLAERTIRVQQILTDKEALEARRRYESGESVASITRSLSTPKRPVSRETVRKNRAAHRHRL